MSKHGFGRRGDALQRERWNAMREQRLERMRERRDKKDKRKGMKAVENQETGAAVQREKADPAV